MAQKSKNNNKMNMNMPRPSMLWIYGLIGLFIIGWYLFDGSNEAPLPSDWTTVQEMVEKGDVEKIQVVNRDQAQVFLKKEAGEKYRNDSVDKRFRRLPESGVQLTFTIGSVDSFREDLKAAEEKSGQTVPVIYENKANDWTSILINLLPWVVIIGAWFFIMRSMSRGAGAGGGGGIMNVGKAKAQVFDKDNSKRVTFKDVAGLEEAKVEIMEIVDFLKKADKYKELGAAWYLPEERQITTREQMMDELAATLGGRVSEQLTFGEISTGALNDLERVTKQAYAMVAYYGMSENVGTLSFYDSTGQSDMAFTKPYSELTAQQIDAEAKQVIEKAYKMAEKVLREHADGLKELAELLLSREVVFTEDVERIFGRRKKDIERERREAEAKARAEGGKPAGEEPQAGKQAAAVADPSAKSDKSETAEPAPVAPAVAAPETE